jgi:hypothetical protein
MTKTKTKTKTKTNRQGADTLCRIPECGQPRWPTFDGVCFDHGMFPEKSRPQIHGKNLCSWCWHRRRAQGTDIPGCFGICEKCWAKALKAADAAEYAKDHEEANHG